MAERSGEQSQRRVELHEVLCAIAAMVGGLRDRSSPEEVLAAAKATLVDVGAREALLESMASLLAYSTAPIPAGACPLEEEAMAVEVARRAVLPLEQDRLQRHIHAVERAASQATQCPEAGCGHAMHSVGRKPRTLVGCHGAMTVTLQWKKCSGPDRGHRHAPAAAAVGIGPHKFTPRARSLIGLASTSVPYGKAVELLASMTGIEVSEREAQVLTMERGRAVYEQDLADAERFAPYEASGLERVCGRPQDAVPESETQDIVYAELDGVLPMTREQLKGEVPHHPGARGGKGRRYKLEGREVKNAVLYRGEAAVQEMPSRGCLLARTYVSHLGHWHPFALSLWLAMLRLRYDKAKLVVVIGDGAAWITSLVEWLPRRVKVMQILDFYHASHRIWEVARAVHGGDSVQTATSARRWCGVVEQGGADILARDLAKLAGLSAAAREKVDELITYLQNNKDHMDYPTYRQQGLRITSGIVESANYHVTGARLKQQGMRWSVSGAERLAVLRADLSNGNWHLRSKRLLAA